MSFANAKYFPMIATNMGVRRRMRTAHSTSRGPKSQACMVPDSLYFSSVSNLLKAFFRSGNINGDDVKKWDVGFSRTPSVSTQLCNPSVQHSVGTQWMLTNDSADVVLSH